MVVDGGPGQLSAAVKGMEKAGVKPMLEKDSGVGICALAKQNEDVYVVDQSAPVNTRPDSPGLLLLRHLRDESHRFALSHHRSRRSILKSL